MQQLEIVSLSSQIQIQYKIALIARYPQSEAESKILPAVDLSPEAKQVHLSQPNAKNACLAAISFAIF